MNRQDHSQASEQDWDSLVEALSPIDFLLLEQLYVVERGPMPLRTVQLRLGYVNSHPRTISRHAEHLGRVGLLAVVTSCEVLLNPLPTHYANVERLVRIWRLREERALSGQISSPNVGAITAAR